MEWVTKPTVFVTPIFIVWRTINGQKKGRVIADLQAINKVAIPNNYPLPSQKEILNYLIGIEYILVFDISGYFH